MSVAKKLTMKIFKFSDFVEGMHVIVQGSLIVRVTTTLSEDSMCSMQHAPFQGPKCNRPQGNAGLQHCHTQLCCRSWRVIHVIDMNHRLVPDVFCGVHIRTFGWSVHDFHIVVLQEFPICSGYVAHGAIQHNQLTFATVKSSPYDDRWHYHLLPAHRHQWASHPADYAPEIVHLYVAIWMLTRQWRYIAASGGSSKYNGVLPTDTGADNALVSLGYGVGLWEWYSTVRRHHVMVHTDRCPVRWISWALNLELDRNLWARIILSEYRSSQGVEILSDCQEVSD